TGGGGTGGGGTGTGGGTAGGGFATGGHGVYAHNPPHLVMHADGKYYTDTNNSAGINTEVTFTNGAWHNAFGQHWDGQQNNWVNDSQADASSWGPPMTGPQWDP